MKVSRPSVKPQDIATARQGIAALCPSCEANATSVIETINPYVMIRCHRCDLVFADPLRSPGADFYQKSPIYDLRDVTVAGALATDWTVEGWRFRRARKLLPPAPARVLDVGCGAGRFCHLLENWGYQSTGIDFDTKAIDMARTLFGLSTVHAISWADYVATTPGASFDVVCAFEVLEHLDDPRGFLQTLAWLLVPKGVLILTVPNRYRSRIGINEEADRPPHHLTWWTAEALRDILLRTGWYVERLETSPVMTFPLISSRVGLGVIQRRQRPEGQDVSPSLQATKRSAALAQAKIMVARVLTSPLDLLLSLNGYRGESLFVVARKQSR